MIFEGLSKKLKKKPLLEFVPEIRLDDINILPRDALDPPPFDPFAPLEKTVRAKDVDIYKLLFEDEVDIVQQTIDNERLTFTLADLNPLHIKDSQKLVIQLTDFLQNVNLINADDINQIFNDQLQQNHPDVYNENIEFINNVLNNAKNINSSQIQTINHSTLYMLYDLWIYSNQNPKLKQTILNLYNKWIDEPSAKLESMIERMIQDETHLSDKTIKRHNNIYFSIQDKLKNFNLTKEQKVVIDDFLQLIQKSMLGGYESAKKLRLMYEKYHTSITSRELYRAMSMIFDEIKIKGRTFTPLRRVWDAAFPEFSEDATLQSLRGKFKLKSLLKVPFIKHTKISRRVIRKLPKLLWTNEPSRMAETIYEMESIAKMYPLTFTAIMSALKNHERELTKNGETFLYILQQRLKNVKRSSNRR